MKRQLQKGRCRKTILNNDTSEHGHEILLRFFQLWKKFQNEGLSKEEDDEFNHILKSGEYKDDEIHKIVPSEANKRRQEQNKIGLQRLKANEDDSKLLEGLLHNWSNLQKQRQEESVERAYINFAELTIFEKLRIIETKYHLAKLFLDRFLKPPPSFFQNDQNHPPFLLSPYERIGTKNEEQLKLMLEKYHETLENDPTPVKELYHIWDKGFVEKDVIGDIKVTPNKTPFLIMNEYRHNGQKYLTLVLRIDAEQNLNDVVFPEIKEIITLRRKQIKGFKERRWSKNRHKQISAYKAFDQNKSPRIILNELGLTGLTDSLTKENLSTTIGKAIYAVDNGKLILKGNKLDSEERIQLRLKLRKYLNAIIGKNTNL